MFTYLFFLRQGLCMKTKLALNTEKSTCLSPYVLN